jgi:pimeloyl-ACP methyl ester carboxylesterase
VVDAIGAEADLLGQSYGATVALGALPLVPRIRRAVLFDPRAYLGGEVTSWADELDAMLAAGEREAMLMKIYRAVLPERADELRAAPEFEQDLRLVPTIPRESRTNDYRPFDPRPYAAVDTPALFLTGSASGPEFHRTIEAAHAVLRNSKVTVRGRPRSRCQLEGAPTRRPPHHQGPSGRPQDPVGSQLPVGRRPRDQDVGRQRRPVCDRGTSGSLASRAVGLRRHRAPL